MAKRARLDNAQPIDVSALTYKAKSDDTLLPPPSKPKYRVALVGCYVDSHPTGGSDKLTNGHRFDSVGLANGLINAGVACQLVFYNVNEHDKFFEIMPNFDGIIIRINPGQITANGGNQQKFDSDMMKVAEKIPVWPTPETMEKMGAKDALCMIKDMDFGMADTLGYYAPEDMEKGFRETIAFQPRVVKQNRGSSGEGIWIIKLKSGNYCKKFKDRAAGDDEVLILKEANDNHIEEHTVAEFIEFCVNGRTGKSGTWTSAGAGKYFEGGREAGGQMVDQRFLPRIDEGEARFMMIGPKLNRVEHYVYIGGVGGETKTTIFEPEAADFPYKEIQAKLEKEIPDYLRALGLPPNSLPLLWAADFIPIDDHKSPLVIGEFNCSCLGLAGFLNARGKNINDLPAADAKLGQGMADLIGQKALEALEAIDRASQPIDVSALTYKAKSDDTLMPPPAMPKYRVALVGSYVDSHPTGGSDKLTNGHRFDSVGLANGLINAGIACQLVFYNVNEHDQFFELMSKFDGILIRINPGQITANGGNQQKFDSDMMKVAEKIPVWPTPETMEKMGAKDALCMIKDMDFGLTDTLGYYTPEDMEKGFRETIAFQPRVVKQNRGSSGEGIWIIKLKSGNYCKKFKDRAAGDDEVLILKEANDNHIEEHTVAEFIEFCVNGRSEKSMSKSGKWTSAGTGKYFEGGREAGGQMVDQRFLPRIDEGEARFMMIGPKLTRVEHYVYIGGVGGETKTTIFKPEAADFPYKETQAKLEKEIPDYLRALGLPLNSLPLLWAADFIPVDDHKCPLVIGEFNCSCLGLAGFLNARGKSINDLPAADAALGQGMANLIGQKAFEALERSQ